MPPNDLPKKWQAGPQTVYAARGKRFVACSDVLSINTLATQVHVSRHGFSLQIVLPVEQDSVRHTNPPERNCCISGPPPPVYTQPSQRQLSKVIRLRSRGCR